MTLLLMSMLGVVSTVVAHAEDASNVRISAVTSRFMTYPPVQFAGSVA
jgi:hypothetical protein